jgi:hypothetical protein
MKVKDIITGLQQLDPETEVPSATPTAIAKKDLESLGTLIGVRMSYYLEDIDPNHYGFDQYKPANPVSIMLLMFCMEHTNG